MKELTLTFLIIFLTNNCFSQKEMPKNRGFVISDQVDVDLEFLAIGVGYKFKISDRWQMGPDVGFGLGLTIGHASVLGTDRIDVGRNSTTLGFEFLRLGVMFKYYPSKRLSFELGPKTGVFILGATADNGIHGNDFLIDLVSGLGGGIYYGNKIEVGIRFTMGLFTFSDFPVFAVNSNFLTIRVPIPTSAVKE